MSRSHVGCPHIEHARIAGPPQMWQSAGIM